MFSCNRRWYRTFIVGLYCQKVCDESKNRTNEAHCQSIWPQTNPMYCAIRTLVGMRGARANSPTKRPHGPARPTTWRQSSSPMPGVAAASSPPTPTALGRRSPPGRAWCWPGRGRPRRRTATASAPACALWSRTQNWDRFRGQPQDRRSREKSPGPHTASSPRT